MKRRHRAIGRPTAEQQRHQDAQRSHGCAMCHLRGTPQAGPTELHHLTTGDLHGQKQLGQAFTVALCSWCHRGVPSPHYPTASETRQAFGPSFALHKKSFMDELWRKLGERSMEALMRYQNSRIERRAA